MAPTLYSNSKYIPSHRPTLGFNHDTLIYREFGELVGSQYHLALLDTRFIFARLIGALRPLRPARTAWPRRCKPASVLVSVLVSARERTFQVSTADQTAELVVLNAAKGKAAF